VQLGSTLIFLRDRGLLIMHDAILSFLNRQASYIQRKYQTILISRLFRLKQQKVSIIKTFLQMANQRRQYLLRLSSLRKIQLFYISRKLRKRFIHEIRCKLAAIMIQKQYRGHRVYQQYQRLSLQWIQVQTRWRQYHAKRQYQWLRKQYISLQASIRCFIQYRKYHRTRHAIMVISKYYRRYHQKQCYYRIYRQMIQIQSVIRQFIHRKRYQRSVSKLIIVAKLIRRFIHYRNYHRIRRAIQRIQRTIRAFLQNRRLLHILDALHLGQWEEDQWFVPFGPIDKQTIHELMYNELAELSLYSEYGTPI
jgi:myosin-5